MATNNKEQEEPERRRYSDVDFVSMVDWALQIGEYNKEKKKQNNKKLSSLSL